MNELEKIKDAVNDLLSEVANTRLFRFLLSGTKLSYIVIISMVATIMFPFLLYILTGIMI